MTPFGESLYWRESQKPARFGPVDYRAVLFVIPILLYFRVVTVLIAIIALSIFFFLERKKIQPDNVLRWIRSTLAGAEIPPHGYDSVRQPVDFGFETDEDIARYDAFIKKHVDLVKQGKRIGSNTDAAPEGKTKSKLHGINYA